MTGTDSTTTASGAIDRIGLLRQMIRIRHFEQRCVQLYSAEKIRG